jgi:acyl-CoA synthetase (AMP-forming)/AMP-acid ligase II
MPDEPLTAQPPLTVPAALAHLRLTCAERDALVTLQERLSWRELDDRSRDLAAVLVARGVNRRSRVGLLMGNGLDWAAAAFAITRIGAVLVPLSTLLRAPELEQQLRVAAVQYLILIDSFRGRDYLAEFAELEPTGSQPIPNSPRLPALRDIWRWSELATERPQTADLDLVDALERRSRPADDLAIMFTSGSRGLPKGVIHTHGNALRGVTASLPRRSIRAGDRLYIPMPFFWMGGFGGGLLTVLAAGATLLTEATPEPTQTLTLLSRERATLFRGWPDQAVALASNPAFSTADLSSLRAGSLDAVLPDVMRAAPGARSNLFGMTETFGPYCADPLDTDMPEAAWGSCGTPFPTIEVRINPDDSEIWLRGAQLMRGICGREREDVFTEDGWYRTGDVGRLDATGRLFYLGRLDDMLKVRGATVYPSEVETALNAIPFVARAFVTDIQTARGTEVAAVVVPVADRAVSTEDVLADAKRQLSAFKLPTVLRMLEPGQDVARTASGKVDKAALQALLTVNAII